MKNSQVTAWEQVRSNQAVILVLLGVALLLLPCYYNLATNVWWRDEQGHGPVICLVSWWLMWRKFPELEVGATPVARIIAWIALLLALGIYILGYSQSIDTLEVLSLNLLLSALVLLLFGWAGLRKLAFPLGFMFFMVPMPGIFVQVITLPIKILVSQAASSLLYWAGYPIARSGVVLSVGQYQILVADACAGLNTLFTLESIGLLYMYLNPIGSKIRNILLVSAIVPIAFISNVIRVLILILLTYHAGDDVGQGFMHQFAGLLLFVFALLLMFLTDAILSRVFPVGANVAA